MYSSIIVFFIIVQSSFFSLLLSTIDCNFFISFEKKGCLPNTILKPLYSVGLCEPVTITAAFVFK